MTVIARVTSQDPQLMLAPLLTAPLGLDVWEVKPDHVVLQASEAQIERLEQMGYGVEQLHMTQTYLSTFATAEATAGYHSAEQLEQDLRALAVQHSDIAELREIGRSLENRPIWALRLGDRHGTDRKVLLLGCHHAREWISVEVPYLLAEHLLDRAGADPVQRWLQRGEIWVAPMINPDGHEFSRTDNRLWRKNRRQNADGSFGVDPNRNYGYMWGILNVNTSSHVPQDETYVGPRAFSEPEVRAVRNLVAIELFSGVLTYHSYSQLILYPWGYTSNPLVDTIDSGGMQLLAEKMKGLIHSVHGRTYTPEQASMLYPTAGDTTDWTYGEYGIWSLTIELRPSSQAEGGFILPPSQIRPTFEENLPAAFEFIGQALDPDTVETNRLQP
jgi:carboxypeptidase T